MRYEPYGIDHDCPATTVMPCTHCEGYGCEDCEYEGGNIECEHCSEIIGHGPVHATIVARPAYCEYHMVHKP